MCSTDTEQKQTIYEFVRKQRGSYRSDTIQITDGCDFSQYETWRTIELYHNSRFLTGSKGNLDLEKPFHNICKFRENVATRATDLAAKDVQIEAARVTKTCAPVSWRVASVPST